MMVPAFKVRWRWVFRRSVMVKEASTLVQLRRDRRELGIQFGAKAVHNRDDCDRNASGDEAILDGGRARLVFEKRL